jgi:hypothetical protein
MEKEETMSRKEVYSKYINVFREVIRRMSDEPELKPKDLSKILALAGIYRELENKYGSHPYWLEKFDQLVEETLENDAIDPQRTKEYLVDIHNHAKFH